MSYRYIAIMAILCFANSLLLGDIYDLYEIPAGRRTHPDIQTMIASLYLQQDPFPFTASQTIPFEDSALIFNVNYTHPWGVDYTEKDIEKFDGGGQRPIIDPNHITTFEIHDRVIDTKYDLWERTDQGAWTLMPFDYPFHPWPTARCITTQMSTSNLIPPFVSSHIYVIHHGSPRGYCYEERMLVDIKYRHMVISNQIFGGKKGRLKSNNQSGLFLFKGASSWKLFVSSCTVFEIPSILPTEIIGNNKLIATILPEDPTLVYIWKHIGNNKWKQLATLKHNSPVYSAAFNPTYTEVVTASANNEARLWQLSPTLFFPFLIDYMPNEKMNLEQLLFLKLINNYWVKNKIDLKKLAKLYHTPLSMNLPDSSVKGVLRYFEGILDSFGPVVKDELINRYSIVGLSHSMTMSKCSIQ